MTYSEDAVCADMFHYDKDVWDVTEEWYNKQRYDAVLTYNVFTHNVTHFCGVKCFRPSSSFHILRKEFLKFEVCYLTFTCQRLQNHHSADTQLTTFRLVKMKNFKIIAAIVCLKVITMFDHNRSSMEIFLIFDNHFDFFCQILRNFLRVLKITTKKDFEHKT